MHCHDDILIHGCVCYASFTHLLASNVGMRKSAHNAMYGNIVIPRGYCTNCETYAFIIDGELRCCGKRSNEAPETFKRMSDMPLGRKTPNKKTQAFILNEQEHRCFYCWRRFGQTVYRGSRDIRLKLHWDHVNPYSYSLDNQNSNFVAACHVCNGIKSNLMFKDADDARITITQRWGDKGYSDVPPVSILVQRETSMAKVLYESMPSGSVVQSKLQEN